MAMASSPGYFLSQGSRLQLGRPGLIAVLGRLVDAVQRSTTEREVRQHMPRVAGGTEDGAFVARFLGDDGTMQRPVRSLACFVAHAHSLFRLF